MHRRAKVGGRFSRPVPAPPSGAGPVAEHCVSENACFIVDLGCLDFKRNRDGCADLVNLSCDYRLNTNKETNTHTYKKKMSTVSAADPLTV